MNAEEIPTSNFDQAESDAVLLAMDTTQFRTDGIRLFYLTTNRLVRPFIEQGIRQGRFRLPHLVDIYDDPEILSVAVQREQQRWPNKIMVVRLFTFGRRMCAWNKPMILDATVRVVLIGDLAEGARGEVFLQYLSDQSKFGDSLMSHCSHPNFLLCNVGFYANNADLGARFAAAVSGGSTSIFVGLGAKIAPWFSKSVIGSWGVKAIVGATASSLAFSVVGGYYTYKWTSSWWAKGGASGAATGERLRIEDVLAFHSDGLGSVQLSDPSDDDFPDEGLSLDAGHDGPSTR